MPIQNILIHALNVVDCNQNIRKQPLMCFIKQAFISKQGYGQKMSPDSITDGGLALDIPFPPMFSHENNGFKFIDFSNNCGLQNGQTFKLKALIHDNSSLLTKLQQKVDCIDHLLQKQIECMEEERSNLPIQRKLNSHGLSSDRLKKQSNEPLLRKIFGERQYAFRLKLREKLGPLIYKSRNIQLNFHLVDSEGKKILNSNLINICVAVCDSKGEWIPEFENGEYFMGGKTQTDLYHGEGSFVRVFPRDVSRSFPNGKVSLVIYAKPSSLRFSSNAISLEQSVDVEDIEPLIIKNITILAKKKAIRD